MKSINNYISEKLIINKNTGKKYYKYFPETIDELQDIIEQRIFKEGFDRSYFPCSGCRRGMPRTRKIDHKCE